jgi:hypothetical protein
MADDEDEIDTIEKVATIGNEVMAALQADRVVVKLLAGNRIIGSIVSFTVRRKAATEGKKPKPASCRGTVSIQITPGVLEVDCTTIESITVESA